MAQNIYWQNIQSAMQIHLDHLLYYDKTKKWLKYQILQVSSFYRSSMRTEMLDYGPW